VVFATEKQRAFNVRKLRFAGWQGKSFEDFDMVGMRILLTNSHQEATEGKNAGKIYDNFDLVVPPTERKELESKPGIKRKLNALLSKELRESFEASPAVPERRQNAAAVAPPKQEAEDISSDGCDDETPF
jgi:hypothetical protein